MKKPPSPASPIHHDDEDGNDDDGDEDDNDDDDDLPHSWIHKNVAIINFEFSFYNLTKLVLCFSYN